MSQPEPSVLIFLCLCLTPCVSIYFSLSVSPPFYSFFSPHCYSHNLILWRLTAVFNMTQLKEQACGQLWTKKSHIRGVISHIQ